MKVWKQEGETITHQRLEAGEEVRIFTPAGTIEIRAEKDSKTVSVWAWDEDEWEGLPKPEIIDVRGEKCLYFVLSDKVLKARSKKDE